MRISMCVIAKSFGSTKSSISLCLLSFESGSIEFAASLIWRENLLI